jgi:hypothetical protein
MYRLGFLNGNINLDPAAKAELERVAEANTPNADLIRAGVNPQLDGPNWSDPNVVGYEQVPARLGLPFPKLNSSDLPATVIKSSTDLSQEGGLFIAEVINWLFGAKQFNVRPRYNVKYQADLVDVVLGKSTLPGNNKYSARFAAWLVLRQYDIFVQYFTAGSPLTNQDVFEYTKTKVLYTLDQLKIPDNAARVIRGLMGSISVNDPKENIAGWICLMLGPIRSFVVGDIRWDNFPTFEAAYIKLIPITAQQFNEKFGFSFYDKKRLETFLTEGDYKYFMDKYGDSSALKKLLGDGNDTPSKLPLILGLAVLAGGVYVFMKRRSP